MTTLRSFKCILEKLYNIALEPKRKIYIYITLRNKVFAILRVNGKADHQKCYKHLVLPDTFYRFSSNLLKGYAS